MDVDVREVHVVPQHATGRWLVEAGEPSARTSHGTANEAEDAARRFAGDRGARCIFLHDRYERVRAVGVR